MSDIPYNYGSYIDAKVNMTDNGHVDSGKQMQSPASAGSRGLAKTTQFTNNKTQMQLGQSEGNTPIAESMIQIQNILSRIDGICVPVSEDDGDERAIAQMKTDRDSDMQDMTIMDIEAQLGKINDEITFLKIDQKDKESALAALGALRTVLDKYQSQKESAVQEDAGDEQKWMNYAKFWKFVNEIFKDKAEEDISDQFISATTVDEEPSYTTSKELMQKTIEKTKHSVQDQH